ncbi:uncharacterized protein Dsimw501_GD29204 [Drosophila simulans]|nr:uncharacterized protein Dsimw501_GD29204 [Drosophila simulans]
MSNPYKPSLQHTKTSFASESRRTVLSHLFRKAAKDDPAAMEVDDTSQEVMLQ